MIHIGIKEIREQFKALKDNNQSRGNTYEIQNAQFIADDVKIFGTPNQKYIEAELEWYNSQSLNVNDLFDIYGKEVKIWVDISDDDGFINSNYGWCVYSHENGNQFNSVRNTLLRDPNSRQAVMLYTRPTMHYDSTRAGRRDFMCTTHVQYFVNDGQLDASVYMRSNDAIVGFLNDLAWQHEVQRKLADQLGLVWGDTIWNAGSLHVYEWDWDKIQ